MSKYHSLPTVFSGNDYTAAISANEVKKWIGWHTHLKKQKQQIDSIQDPHPYFSVGLNFGTVSEQRTFVKTIAMLFSGGELSSSLLNGS